MTHTFIEQKRITLTLDPVCDGVDIMESNYPDDDVTIFISRDRIEDVINFLHSALAEFLKEANQ